MMSAMLPPKKTKWKSKEGKSKKAKGKSADKSISAKLIEIGFGLIFAFLLLPFALQNYPAVGGAARDALAVEIF
jgi:hypothetical protein